MDRFYNRIILDGLDHPELLSEWECGFIASLAEKDEDFELSDKQKEVLRKIEHKIAAGG